MSGVDTADVVPPAPGLLMAMPFGVAVFDGDHRLLWANPALAASLGVSPALLRSGATLSEYATLAAHRGVFGPGDPGEQARDITALDFERPHLLRRRGGDGHSFEAHFVPIEPGGVLACLLDTSGVMSMRDEAGRAIARLHTAVANLRIGMAVFAPDRTIGLHNRVFGDLLGLPPGMVQDGMAFDTLLAQMQRREDFPGLEGEVFLAGQRSLDRRISAEFRRVRANGQVIDVHSDPLPDGGWTLTVADVSALVRAQDDASRRAGMLDTILRQIPHGIAVWGPDRRVAMINDAYLRVMDGAPIHLGETQEELVRRRAEAGEYGPGNVEALVTERLNYDVRVPQLYRRRRPDGRTIDVRTAPLPDGGHISVVADVSDLVEAQAELVQKAELMASIVSHIPHGVSVYGPDRRLRLVNAAYNTIMAGAPIVVGESVDEVIEKRARAGEYGPGDPDEVSRQQRAFDNSKPQMRRRRRANGSTIDIRTAPLPDGGHISVVTDVTPLMEAEAEAARRAVVMDAMLANIRHGIILWDKDARIVACNAVVGQLLAAPPGLLVPGTRLEQVITSALDRGNLGAGSEAQIRARWLSEQNRGQSHSDQRLTRNGRVLEVRSDPAPGGGFVTTYTDVTEIRQAEEALRLAKTAAEAANVAKSRFLASMSTELRNPLTAIMAEMASLGRAAAAAGQRSAQGFGTAGVDAASVQDAAESSATMARQLLGMIDSILDVARLEAGRFDLVEDLVDVHLLVRQCLRQHDSAAAAAEVALVVDLPATLPKVRADERRLRQVLAHLVSNAVRHTEPMGSVAIVARVEWAIGDLLIEVQDTGPGIPDADVDRVFEPFTQLETGPVDTTGRGPGLGLYTSRTLMRAHGGDVRLRSVPGRGTTATICIPAERVVQDDVPDPT